MTSACTFGPIRVEYDARVLAPRPWTLAQSRHALTALDRGPDGPILELHCGAGHIGQATAAWSGRGLVQVDDDPAACEWARANAAGNGLTADVWCTSVDALDGAAGAFALVLADPPYVPADEMAQFVDDPTHAIDGGPDGLAGFRKCLPVAARLTASTGSVVLQVRGPRQAAEVEHFVSECCPELRPADAVTVGPDRTVMTFVRA